MINKKYNMLKTLNLVMTNKYAVCLILMFSLHVSCCSQVNNNETLIIGKWTGTKKETKNGIDKLTNGKPNREFGIYEFRQKNVAIDYTFAPSIAQCPYFIKGSVLKFGRLTFKIEKLTERELVIIDYDEKNPNDPLVFRHYFVKK